MKPSWIFFICVVCNGICSANMMNAEEDVFPWEEPLNHLVSSTPVATQQEAVEELVKRLLPFHINSFVISIDPSLRHRGRDAFKVFSSPESSSSSGGKVVNVVGSSGVAASSGLHHYLKHFCHAHISWDGNQLDVPNPLPDVNVTVVFLDRFRYYQNVCTASYSFTWWHWPQWEVHIDWMALNGINLPLALTGEEAIWQRVYRRFNLTDEDLDKHFPGPAFLTWGRMGNLKGWGGPLTPTWHRMTLILQHQILKRMRSFGMTPVLPAFAGHVPDGIKRIFPEANVTRLDTWGHFSDEYTRIILLDPRDPVFSEIGSAFMLEMEQEFNGTDHAYSCDTFNEMIPPINSTDYISQMARAVFQVMNNSDTKAVWVMQGWLFFNSKEFWTKENAKALLTSVPLGRLLVLDLHSDVYPQYDRLDSYFGQPFIFCLLHNYGGVQGLYGRSRSLLQNMKAAREFPNGTLVGTGLTPEGIHQNYVIYDLMLDLGYREPDFDLYEWATNYSSRRYRGLRQNLTGHAWRALIRSVYQCDPLLRFHSKHILITQRPTLTRQPFVWYNVRDLVSAWDLLMKSASPGVSGVVIRSFDANKQAPHSVYPKGGHGLGAFRGTRRENETYDSYSMPTWAKEALAIGHLSTFRRDLVDVTREALQILGDHMIEGVCAAYNISSTRLIKFKGQTLLKIMDDLDVLLKSNEGFLLGRWIKAARSWAHDKQETMQYVSNALNQITLWGPKGEILDYATKQWAGVVRHYYRPRYQMFIEDLLDDVTRKRPFNASSFNQRVFEQVEFPFANNPDPDFSPDPVGDSIEIAHKIHRKYRRFFSPGLLGSLERRRQKRWVNVAFPDSHVSYDDNFNVLI